MEKKGIEILEKFATTKYADLKGIISIDKMDNADFIKLCRDNSIDMDAYYLLGFGLMAESMLGIGRRDHVVCHVLLLEKEIYGNTHDEIKSKLERAESVAVIKKHFSMKYTDLSKYIKRFSFMTATKMIDNIKAITVQDDYI
jgi:hypothetical protein